jgi:hypothetical protein
MDMLIENFFYFLGGFLFSIISTFIIILIFLFLNYICEKFNEDSFLEIGGSIGFIAGFALPFIFEETSWKFIYIIPIAIMVSDAAIFVVGIFLYFISSLFVEYKIKGGIGFFIIISGILITLSLRRIDGFYISNELIILIKQVGVYFLCFEFMLILLIIPILLGYLIFRIIESITK